MANGYSDLVGVGVVVLVPVLGVGVRAACGVLRVRCGFGLPSGQVGGVRHVALAQPQDDERDQGGEQHKDAGPDVEPGGDAKEVDLFGVVDPQGLDPDAAQGVGDGVEPEQPCAAEGELPV